MEHRCVLLPDGGGRVWLQHGTTATGEPADWWSLLPPPLRPDAKSPARNRTAALKGTAQLRVHHPARRWAAGASGLQCPWRSLPVATIAVEMPSPQLLPTAVPVHPCNGRLLDVVVARARRSSSPIFEYMQPCTAVRPSPTVGTRTPRPPSGEAAMAALPRASTGKRTRNSGNGLRKRVSSTEAFRKVAAAPADPVAAKRRELHLDMGRLIAASQSTQLPASAL